MIKLIWLLLGWGVAAYGLSLIPGAPWADYRLRDGLLLALPAAGLFAWHSAALIPLWPRGGRRGWPPGARIAAWTALACAPAATLLLAWSGGAIWAVYPAASLWAVGMLAWAVGLLWPTPVQQYVLPPLRWRVDAAGNWVRYAADQPPTDDPAPSADLPEPTSLWQHPLYPALYLILLAVGVILRLWQLTTQPATCVGAECAAALQLMDGAWPRGFAPDALGLYALAVRVAYGITEDSVGALRWASAGLGIALLPVAYWATRAFVRPPAALLSLGLVALLPWALWSSRLGSDWGAAPLLLLVAVGAAGRGLVHPQRRWWALAGGALGLLLAQPLPLTAPTGIYLLGLAAAGWWAQDRGRMGLTHAAGVALGCALVVGLPLGWLAWTQTAPTVTDAAAGGGAALGGALWVALLHGGGISGDARALLPPWLAALALAGLAAAARWAARPRSAVVIGGALVYAAGLTWLAPAVDPAQSLLPLLPWIAVGSALAAESLLTAFDRAWARLVPPPRAAAAALGLLLLLVGRDAWNLTGEWARSSSSAQNAADIAMGQFLAACVRGEMPDDPCSRQGEDAPHFYVAPTALEHPATRLLLGSAQAAGRVFPFDPGRDLLPLATPPGDLFFLVALDNQPVIALLQQVYPTAQLRAEPRDQAGPTLFLVAQVGRADLLARQGLRGEYSVGDVVVETRQEGSLSFAWGSAPPLLAPFRATWTGSLIVPAAGGYTFFVEGMGGPTAPLVSLHLDGRVALDTSLGLLEQRVELAQGVYTIRLHSRADAPPADWAVRWIPPGGAPGEIPRSYLQTPALPNQGLLGRYFAGSAWEGAPLTTRKDWLLGAPVDLPTPYSVLWTGQVAASRAGEYVFAVTANGPVTLRLDDRDALTHLPPTDLASGPGYSQVGIYLTQGWHRLDLRYAPTGAPDLRLLWQPPGSGPALLAASYLLPTEMPVSAADVPLPPLPELLDARLGDDHFALNMNLEAQPLPRSLPPANLPMLLAEPLWQTPPGCGAGDLLSPRGVAVDVTRGRLYVADGDGRQVLGLALDDGRVLERYALADFAEPVDVALLGAAEGSGDGMGALLVLDAVVPAIFKIDLATGESGPLALSTGFYRPRGLAVDALGHIGVADTGGARVVILDATGAPLAQFGGPQTALGQGQPVAVMALGGQWWAMAADAGRLWRLDVLGSLAVSARANTVTGPHLAPLPDGRGFFLSDSVQRTVLYLAATGEPLAQLGYSDTLVNPTGVAAYVGVDGLLHLAVADSGTCSVGIWRVRL